MNEETVLIDGKEYTFEEINKALRTIKKFAEKIIFVSEELGYTPSSSFLDEVRIKQLLKVFDVAEEFADKMKNEIVEATEKGHTNIKFHIEHGDENKEMYKNKHFIDRLNVLMDGVKVSHESSEGMRILGNTIINHYIVFDWGVRA